MPVKFLSQRFYLKLDSLPARYDNVMNSLTTASAEANRRSQAFHLLALGLSGLAALLVLVEKWLGLRKRNVTTPPGP